MKTENFMLTQELLTINFKRSTNTTVTFDSDKSQHLSKHELKGVYPMFQHFQQNFCCTTGWP